MIGATVSDARAFQFRRRAGPWASAATLAATTLSHNLPSTIHTYRPRSQVVPLTYKRHLRFIPPFLTMTTQSCLICGTPSTKLCSSCKTASYCGAEHQKMVGSKNYTPSANVPICFACRTGGRIKSTAARSRRLVPTRSMPSSLPRMKPSLVSLRFLGSLFPGTRTNRAHTISSTKMYGSKTQIRP